MVKQREQAQTTKRHQSNDSSNNHQFYLTHTYFFSFFLSFPLFFYLLPPIYNVVTNRRAYLAKDTRSFSPLSLVTTIDNQHETVSREKVEVIIDKTGILFYNYSRPDYDQDSLIKSESSSIECKAVTLSLSICDNSLGHG